MKKKRSFRTKLTQKCHQIEAERPKKKENETLVTFRKRKQKKPQVSERNLHNQSKPKDLKKMKKWNVSVTFHKKTRKKMEKKLKFLSETYPGCPSWSQILQNKEETFSFFKKNLKKQLFFWSFQSETYQSNQSKKSNPREPAPTKKEETFSFFKKN